MKLYRIFAHSGESITHSLVLKQSMKDAVIHFESNNPEWVIDCIYYLGYESESIELANMATEADEIPI